MGWPFGKKKKADGAGDAEEGEDMAIGSAPEAEAKQGPSFGGAIDIELTKIKSQLEALGEVRKSNSERFQRLSEQIGELRGMITDTNKNIGTVEVAATRAIDLVNAVQPDKLMIDVRKIDSKVEGLRAMIEANEAMMKDIMSEMKSMRKQMNFYKGTEQVMKMNEEVKKEIAEIKHQEALVERHANKVETIFLETEKKFSEFDKFNDITKDLDKGFKKIAADFDKMKIQIDEKAEKKEFVKVIGQFNEFEKHTGNILKLLDTKSKSVEDSLNDKFKALAKSLDSSFEKAKKEIARKHDVQLDEVKLNAEKIAEGNLDQLSDDRKDAMKGLFRRKEAAETAKQAAAPSPSDGLGAHDDKPITQAA